MAAEARLLLYAIILVLVAIALLLLSHVLGPRRNLPGKFEPYECGSPVLGSAREAIPIRFYLVAILFVLFDIETVFLVPWAVIYKKLGLFGIVEMLVFIGVLFLGLLYAWKRGVLEWD